MSTFWWNSTENSQFKWAFTVRGEFVLAPSRKENNSFKKNLLVEVNVAKVWIRVWIHYKALWIYKTVCYLHTEKPLSICRWVTDLNFSYNSPIKPKLWALWATKSMFNPEMLFSGLTLRHGLTESQTFISSVILCIRVRLCAQYLSTHPADIVLKAKDNQVAKKSASRPQDSDPCIPKAAAYLKISEECRPKPRIYTDHNIFQQISKETNQMKEDLWWETESALDVLD